ncbi:MAG TPA: hypothetical protein VJO34_15115 [Methylomirabilota bacterium]|nr:hypothetical protein [Methylomirabilota bacterium]
MNRRHLLWRGGLFCLCAVGLPILFLGALAKKEQDNRFCIACHLHEEKFTRFGAPTAADLAGAHHHAAKNRVHCIDCHGGADLPMRLQVWAVAGLDTIRFFSGRYREPDRMRLPLRDQECKQCHNPIVPRRAVEEPGEERGDSYHEIREHRSVKTLCVDCHTSHTQGEARFDFVDRNRITPICRNCHKQLGVGGEA